MINSTIQSYLPKVIELFKKHKIKNAYIFGSALTDRFNNESDVDFIVNLQDGLNPVDAGEHLWDLEYELKDLLLRDVDLITERSLKNPYFISEINATKIAIYGQ
ncbi:MAG: nucleotidyltransferase domain-containing protein [Paludibacter sp.]|nr:nucleotidyltransferase domain-containing protein [Paludibacter sp.]